MTALTKAEMADHLSELTSLNRREAKQMVELFFDEISQALISGEQVKLSGFGNFELRDKRQRPGRNPKTGGELLNSNWLFDVYTGQGVEAGKRSLAFALLWQHPSRTLEDAEIKSGMDTIIEVL